MSSRRSTSRFSVAPRAVTLALAALAAGGCSFVPERDEAPPADATQAPAEAQSAKPTSRPDTLKPANGAPADAAANAVAGAATEAPAAPVAPPPPPGRAVAEFERAVGLMRSGNATEAELEFKQLALAYPNYPGANINLGLLYRKAGRIDEAVQALQTATERAPASAVAWTELGVTLRMQGKFREALQAYDRAIETDPNSAAAHRNAGVLLDLYLNDPARALAEFERYKEITGEDKPVSGWIAELKQRVAKAGGAPAPPSSSKEAPAAAAEEKS